MSPADNASATALDMFVPPPSMGHRAGDYAQRGTTVGIDAAQAVPAQAASSQKKRPAAQPTTTGTSRVTGTPSTGWFRREGTPTKIMPQPRHPASTPVELTVSAQQQHKVKTVTAASGHDPVWLIHGTELPAAGKYLNTSIRAGPRTPDPPPRPAP